MKFVIRLEYADMVHRETVYDDDQERAIARAWARIRKYLTLPMAYRRAFVESAEEES